MIIYAVELITHDGTEYQKLYKSESSAKEEARKLNKAIGIKNYYKVYQRQVIE